MKQNTFLFCMLLAIGANSFSPAKTQTDVNDSLALVDLYNSTNGSKWYHRNNWLTSVPVDKWYGVKVTSTRVTKVGLSYNGLNGMLPSSIGNLLHLDNLSLYGNQLSGSIPSSIGNLVNLTWLQLGGNPLSGQIPSSIGNLIKLRRLELGWSQLSGEIPASIGNLIKLQYLYLNSNQLSGAIPPSINNCVKLVDFVLEYNQLSGTIPPLGNLSKVNYLILHHNQLSGAIPSSIGNLSTLQALSLSYNQLSGDIPVSFKNLSGTSISLAYNQLSHVGNVDFPMIEQQDMGVGLSNNLFTFDGIELLAQKFPYATYAPQAPIAIHRHGNILAVYAGGTLQNNTYTWYQAGVARGKIIRGDSTFKPAQSGKYYAQVTNSKATQNGLFRYLVLYTDTFEYTMPATAAKEMAFENTVQANNISKRFSIHPNPANSILQVQVNGRATIVITNDAGRAIFSRTITNNAVINVSALANGVYYIRNATTGEVHKLVVLH